MGATVTVTIDDSELVRLINESRGEITPMIIADGVEYGIYQELGTVKMAARPCARPAVEATRRIFAGMFKGALSVKRVQQVLKMAAFTVEGKWKQYIRDQDVIDTGAYLNSVHVVEG